MSERIRVRPSPRQSILSLFETEKSLTRSEIAARLGISYFSARYWLEKLASEGLIQKEVTFIGRNVRRIIYHPLPVEFYYRTQYAIMFYTLIPRSESPDPIAEFRVTVVSDKRGKYNLDEFKDACIHIGIILSPQTYWIKQEMEITADELDEPIDKDELDYSVPVFRMLNYAERYAVFFKSKKHDEDKWRVKYPYWWADKTLPLPAPEKEDYEYAEDYIKSLERKKAALGALKMMFNNEEGRLEPVE
jgi:hypothetical protein